MKSVEGEPHEKAVELLKAAQGLSAVIHNRIGLTVCYNATAVLKKYQYLLAIIIAIQYFNAQTDTQTEICFYIY